MQWQLVVLVASLAFLGAAFSGCVGSAVENSYRDADERVGQSFAGSYTDSKTVNVPAGTSSLRIAVNIETSGGFDLKVRSPGGGVAAEMTQGGVYANKDDSWFQTANPTPGEWKIEISAGGTGAFAVGVYLE